MDEAESNVQRQSGVALWRQIADRIRAAISNGDYDASGRLPPETTLAAHFGVNRHTVRSALAALAQEGVLRSVQGRGTLIMRRDRVSFPISRRTRFTEAVGEQARQKEGLLLEAARETATPEIAAHLGIAPGEDVIRLETLRKADGWPLARSSAWFPASRFAGIEAAYLASGSVTAAFASLGVADYLRISTEITAAHADAGDIEDLALAPGAIVMVTRALNADTAGVPVQYAVSRFPADRVRFTVDN